MLHPLMIQSVGFSRCLVLIFMESERQMGKTETREGTQQGHMANNGAQIQALSPD